MRIKDYSRNGSISTELAISLVLVVAVLIITLGLFGDNVKNMVANSNFKNVFTKNDAKTGFNSFNKDYSDSQINVQIMGEQGLEMLRRKANNEALEILESPAPDKASVLYLALAINAIVGEPDICVYMTKDSKAHCDQDGIGGYAYRIKDINSSPKVAKSTLYGTQDGAQMSLIVNSQTGSAFGPSISGQSTSAGTSITRSTAETYAYIQSLTTNFGSIVSGNAKLMELTDSFRSAITKSEKVAPVLSEKEVLNIKDVLKQLIATVQDSLRTAHKKCTRYGKIFGGDLDIVNGETDCSIGDGWVGVNEKDDFVEWSRNVSKNITNSSSKDAKTIVALLVKNAELGENLDIVNNDHKNRPTTCTVLVNGLLDIKTKFPELSLADVGLTVTQNGSSQYVYTLKNDGESCSATVK